MPVSNEPPKIDNGGENPDNFSHWDIYNAFNPLAPSQKAGDSAEAYQKMATRWSNAASFFGARILQSSSAAWEGNAAEASRTAITNYVQRAEELTDAITALHQQTTTAIDGVTNTKNGTDVPMQHVSRWNFMRGDLLWHHGDRSLSAINEARDKARESMKSNYVANFVSADKQIPVTPQPSPITQPLYTYTPTSGNSPGPSNSGNDGGYNPTSGSGTGNGGTSGTSSESGSQSGTSPNSSTSPSSYSGASNSPSTTPSSYLSGLSSSISTLPSSFGGGTGVGAGTGGYDGGGGGLGGGGLGATSGGGLGKSVPGTTGTNPGTAAAAAGTRAGAATTGMPGLGGLGGAGKGKGDDGDKDRGEIPEWLRNMENTEDLLGPAPKTLPGGVIGGNYDQDPNAQA